MQFWSTSLLKPRIKTVGFSLLKMHLAEVESRTQGSRPRPRTQKKFEAKDSLSEDRHSRGQGQECSRPRTQAQVLSKKKKRSSQKFFRRSPKKKRPLQKFFKRSPQKNIFQKIFQALHKILTIQKILLANFQGLEASRPRPRTSKCVLEAKDILEDSTSDLWHLGYLFTLAYHH